MIHIPIELCSSNLEQLSASVPTPKYDRRSLTRGIVHIGAGGFNRSHLAVYLDDLLGRADTERWGECGIGLRPPDLRIHAALAKQDYLYSVLERDAEQRELRIIGSMVEHFYAPESIQTVLDRLSSPECAIVSMTVTEGGYFIDDSSKQFLSSHPEIQHDLAHPQEPTTFLGYLAEAADRRMKRGHAPFTVMSCDNLQGNGAAARTALLAFTGLKNKELQKWIERNVAFPNSMVDRITPTTTDDDRSLISRQFGVSDQSPVVTEPFRQWVIEDTFSGKRPSWELVGAQITSDVAPFERIKMRMLNGGHLTIAYPAVLLGIQFVSQAMADPLICDLLERFFEEVMPILPDLPGMERASYKASIVHRFSNPEIRDQILRLCSESTAKMAKFIIPSIADLMASGRQCNVLSLIVALWLYSLRGIDATGNPIHIVDTSANLFSEFAGTGCKEAPLALSVDSVFGQIASNKQFVRQVQDHLNHLHANGTRAAIQRLIDTKSSAAT